MNEQRAVGLNSERARAKIEQYLAAFERVVVVEPSGRSLASKGVDLQGENLFDAPEFVSLGKALRECFKGVPFAESGSPDSGLRYGVHGLPVEDEGGQVVAVALVLDDLLDDIHQFNRLKSQVSELEFVVRNIRQGIWRVDEKGKIIFANPFIATWLETTPERMAGRPVSDFMVEQYPSPDPQESAVSERFEARFVTANGLIRHAIVVSSSVRDSAGEGGTSIQLVTDVSADRAVHLRLVSEVQRMATLAGMDVLTGLPNRRAFEAELYLTTTSVPQSEFGVILLDLDGLKEINDLHGHEAGDAALKAFAERMASCVRSQDRVARLGGDEFAILVNNASAADLSEVYARIAERMTFDFRFGGHVLKLHASSGWAHSEEGVGAMLRLADEALYRAKRRHKVEGFGPTLL